MPGVITHDPERACRGYTLFSQSARNPLRDDEPGHPIYLIDMEGSIVHTWQTRSSVQSYSWLLPDGNLIYPTSDRQEVTDCTCGLREIDPQSQVLWYYRCRTDHDFQVLADGNILINTITERMCPALGPELKRHPYLVEITRDKELVWEWKGEDHLDELEQLLHLTTGGTS